MKIKVELSKGSIRAAIQQTKMQAEQIQKLCDLFSKRMAMEGEKLARGFLIASQAELTGTLFSSISYDYVSPGVWKVSCYAPTPSGANYAWFVEFGTGPRGAKSGHPEGKDYKPTGWWTAADGKPMDKIYGWTPHEGHEDGQKVYYTTGQPAKHFMYDSKQWLMKPEVYNRIFAECVREVMAR